LRMAQDWIKLSAEYSLISTKTGKMVVPPKFTSARVVVKQSVDEAHRRGHKVSCHAFGGEGGVVKCINCRRGIDREMAATLMTAR